MNIVCSLHAVTSSVIYYSIHARTGKCNLFVEYNTIQYNTIQRNATQRNTTQHNTMQCNAMQYVGNQTEPENEIHFNSNIICS